MRHLTMIALAAVLVSGCAAHPDDLAALETDTRIYEQQDCDKLAADLATAETRLDRLVERQLTSRTNDSWSVVGFGVFAAFWTGDENDQNREAQIAQLKGEVEAIQEVQKSQC